MPYKLSEDKLSVLKKEGSRWVVVKRHTTKAKAKAHLQALVIHTGH